MAARAALYCVASEACAVANRYPRSHIIHALLLGLECVHPYYIVTRRALGDAVSLNSD